MKPLSRFLPFAFAILLSGSVFGAATAWQSNPQGRVRIITDTDRAPVKGTFRLGLQFQPAPGWYLYWKNPGEAGIPPQVKWNLKKGVTDLQLLWPAPTRLELPGGIVEYGYLGETVYPIEGRLTGGPIHLEADVSYLTCNTSCIPHHYRFILQLPSGEAKTDVASAHLIDSAMARLPTPGATDAQVSASAPVVRLTPGETETSPTGNKGIGGILILAFIGGLLLNVMPCVLPVLTIKLLGLFGHHSHWDASRGALLSSAGILASFEGLALLAIGAKRAGMAVGWGIQFQNPWFIGFLLAVVILFALNLWGVFEIGMPRIAGHFATTFGRHETWMAHFTSGLFATLLATPCSAPFLGTAMGFALAQSPGVILAVFTASGFGMALPYLALAAVPGSIQWLPKPGPWMITLKKCFAIILIVTGLWLAWVLKNQVRPAERAVFDESQIAAYLAQGKPVLVDVTADWCVTCKYNERFVLASSEIQAALRERGVVVMTADWTNRNEAIGRYLNRFGRSGIPFYAYYEPGKDPVTLSEFLTQKQVLSVLRP